MWRGGGISVAASFVWQCLSVSAITPFPIPLIEPDMQIARTRLSDKTSRLHAEERFRDPRLRSEWVVSQLEIWRKWRAAFCSANQISALASVSRIHAAFSSV
jgi:hypothetical protein